MIGRRPTVLFAATPRQPPDRVDRSGFSRRDAPPRRLADWRALMPKSPSTRRRRAMPMTWERAYGLLLGLLGFVVVLATLEPMQSVTLSAAATLAAGLAGMAVSAVDVDRRDWWARLIWACGVTVSGGCLLGAPGSGLLTLESAGLGMQALGALVVFRRMRPRRTARLTAAVAAAAPTAALILVLGHLPTRIEAAPELIQALGLLAFGLTRFSARGRRGVVLGPR